MVEMQIKDEISMMQTQFDGFKQCIHQKLESIQSLDLVGIQIELAASQKAIEQLKHRSVLSNPIIEEIKYKKEVPNIQGIIYSTPIAGDVGAGEKERKKKKRKSVEKNDIKAIKVSNIQSEWDHQVRAREMVVGACCSQLADAIDLNCSTAPLPKLTLSTPATTSVTTELCTPVTTRATDDESVAHTKALYTDTT